MKKRIYALLLSLVLVFALTACGGGNSDEVTAEAPNAGDPIRITTLSETEGTSVGQVMVQALIAHGYEVEDKSGTSASVDVMRQALLDGEADLIWDYDGDAVTYFETDIEPFFVFGEGWQAIHDYDLENNNLVWLDPSEANNSGLVCCTNELAEEYGLETMEDFAEYVNNGERVKCVAPDWWINMDVMLPLLEKGYGFDLTDDQLVVVDGLNEKMVAEGVDDVNFCLVFNHQGSLNELGLTALQDNKSAQLRYSYCPVINKDYLDKYPEIADILNPIFSSLTDEDVRWLNEQVQIQGRPGAEVGIEFLKEKGYIE